MKGWDNRLMTGGYLCVNNQCAYTVAASQPCTQSSQCAQYHYLNRAIQQNATLTDYVPSSEVPNLPNLLSNICSASACTISSTCDSSSDPLFASGAQVHIPDLRDNLTCCHGASPTWTCAQLGNFLDTCDPESECHPNPDGITNNQVCIPVNQKKNQWIGVVITLLGAATLNIGLNLQKLALRKRSERKRVLIREHLRERLDAFRATFSRRGSRRGTDSPEVQEMEDGNRGVEMMQVGADER
ncbi:hypothetical protein HK097_005152, partial [Rhizophlyctis rosea]